MTSIGRAAAGEQHSVDEISDEENGAGLEETDLQEADRLAPAANGDAGTNWFEDGAADGGPE